MWRGQQNNKAGKFMGERPMKQILVICGNYFSKYKRSVFFYILLCVISSISSLITPYISGNFVDLLVGNTNKSSILDYCILYVAIIVFGLLVGYFSNRLYIKISTRLSFEYNRDVLIHLQKIRLSFFYDKDTASLNQRINNDTNTIIAFCLSFFQNFAINGLTIALSLFLIFSFDTFIAIVLVLLVPCYFAAYQFLKKGLFKTGYELKKSQAEYFGKLNEQISSIRQIKLFSLFSSFSNRLNKPFNLVLNNSLKYQNATYVFSTLDTFILSISQIFLFIYGGTQVLSGSISIGIFTILSNYFGMFLSSIRYFFSLGKNIQDVKTSFRRLEDIINISEETVGETIIDNVNEIQVKNVCFSINDKLILSNANFTFNKGNIYVIKGQNGAGKSTLVKLIAGIYIDEFFGEILYNSIPIQDINMYDLRKRQIGILEQEPYLFDDSIRYNALLDEESYDQSAFLKLTEILNLNDFLSQQLHGVESLVGENATAISGGEKQKIAIIRAFLKNPDVFILDEPTSALDSASTNGLKELILNTKPNKIVILITHETTFDEIADNIIYID